MLIAKSIIHKNPTQLPSFPPFSLKHLCRSSKFPQTLHRWTCGRSMGQRDTPSLQPWVFLTDTQYPYTFLTIHVHHKSSEPSVHVISHVPWHWSDYRKSLPGQFVRIRLKIEQNCRLFWDIFVSAIMNDLFMAFTSRLKVDAKCVYQQWNWITVANYFGTPPADWVHGYLYFEPGAWIWTKGFRRYLHIVKNWSGKFSFNSTRVRSLGWPLPGIFFGIFKNFFMGVCGANYL